MYGRRAAPGERRKPDKEPEQPGGVCTFNDLPGAAIGRPQATLAGRLLAYLTSDMTRQEEVADD
jgi:hypothetical protein